MKQLKKAVFLDRDGTINIEKNYLYKIEDFILKPGVIEVLRSFQELGYLLVIITNQSGIARGYYTEEDFLRLSQWMKKLFEHNGVHINGIYYCPHHPDAIVKKYRCKCNCRKPATGLFYEAANDLGIDIDQSIVIGDKLRDCLIAEERLCRGYLVGSNESREVIHDVALGRYSRIRFVRTIDKVLEYTLGGK